MKCFFRKSSLISFTRVQSVSMLHSFGLLAFVTLFVAVSHKAAAAQDRDVGIGIVLAGPTGISFQQNFDEFSAVQGAIAYNFGGFLLVQGDYILKNSKIFNIEPGYGKLYLTYGGGARLEIGEGRENVVFVDNHKAGNEEFAIAARVPVGVQYYFQKAPFDVFAEFAPMLYLVPGTDFSAEVALGGRFNF